MLTTIPNLEFGGRKLKTSKSKRNGGIEKLLLNF